MGRGWNTKTCAFTDRTKPLLTLWNTPWSWSWYECMVPFGIARKQFSGRANRWHIVYWSNIPTNSYTAFWGKYFSATREINWWSYYWVDMPMAMNRSMDSLHFSNLFNVSSTSSRSEFDFLAICLFLTALFIWLLNSTSPRTTNLWIRLVLKLAKLYTKRKYWWCMCRWLS